MFSYSLHNFNYITRAGGSPRASQYVSIIAWQTASSASSSGSTSSIRLQPPGRRSSRKRAASLIAAVASTRCGCRSHVASPAQSLSRAMDSSRIACGKDWSESCVRCWSAWRHKTCRSVNAVFHPRLRNNSCSASSARSLQAQYSCESSSATSFCAICRALMTSRILRGHSQTLQLRNKLAVMSSKEAASPAAARCRYDIATVTATSGRQSTRAASRRSASSVSRRDGILRVCFSYPTCCGFHTTFFTQPHSTPCSCCAPHPTHRADLALAVARGSLLPLL